MSESTSITISDNVSDENRIMKFDRKFLDYIDSPIDYNILEATESTKFSSDLPNQVYQLVDIIGEINPTFIDKKRSLNILDCTGHVGSFALCWAALFRKHNVTAIEIDEFTFARLNNNTKKLGLDDQVTVINADVTKYINKSTKYDFVYIDPPWGGPKYKCTKGIMLYLGSETIIDFIINIFRKRISRYIFLKVPTNFDFQSMPFKYVVHTIMNEVAMKHYPDYLLVCIIKIKHKNNQHYIKPQ